MSTKTKAKEILWVRSRTHQPSHTIYGSEEPGYDGTLFGPWHAVDEMVVATECGLTSLLTRSEMRLHWREATVQKMGDIDRYLKQRRAAGEPGHFSFRLCRKCWNRVKP